MQKLTFQVPAKPGNNAQSSPVEINAAVYFEPAIATEPLADFGVGIRTVEIDTVIYEGANVTNFVNDVLPELMAEYETLALKKARVTFLHWSEEEAAAI